MRAEGWKIFQRKIGGGDAYSGPKSKSWSCFWKRSPLWTSMGRTLSNCSSERGVSARHVLRSIICCYQQ